MGHLQWDRFWWIVVVVSAELLGRLFLPSGGPCRQVSAGGLPVCLSPVAASLCPATTGTRIVPRTSRYIPF